MKSISGLPILFLALTPAPQSGTQLLPRDEAADVEDLVEVRTAILEALDRSDYKTVASYASPEVEAYYDAVPGRAELIRCLKEEGLARSMKQALNAGGTFYREDGVDLMFIAPSLFGNFPDDLDPFTHAIVYGTDVNIRSKPDVKSEILTQLSYHIVEMPDHTPEKCQSGSRHQWHRIKLPDGRHGYLADDFTWTVGSPRFHFMKVNGTWRLEFVMTGE